MHTQDSSSSPDTPVKHSGRSGKPTEKQARLNVCLVIVVTILTIILFSLLLFGALILYIKKTDSTSPTSSHQETNRFGAMITPNNVAHLTETRHMVEENIGGAVYSSDGTLIAVGMVSKILLYSPDTMDIVHTLRGHQGRVNALAFAPDIEGQPLLLASGAVDETTIQVWNVDTGQTFLQLNGHTGWIRSVTFSPDGTHIASGATDQTIRIWNSKTGEEQHTLRGHTDMVSNVVFSPDSTLLASTSRDGSVKVWDVATGTEQQTIFTLPDEVKEPRWTTGLAFHPDGTHLAIGATDGIIRIVSLAEGTVEQTLEGHNDLIVIQGLAYQPTVVEGGRLLASASADGMVHMWDTASGTMTGTLDHDGLQVLGIHWHPDGKTLISSSDSSGEVYIWDVATQKLAQSLPLTQEEVTTLSYSPNGQMLGSAGKNGVVRLTPLNSEQMILLSGAAHNFQSLAFINNNEVMIAKEDEGGVTLFDTTRLKKPQPLFDKEDGTLQHIAISPSYERVALGSSLGKVIVWDTASQSLVRDIRSESGGGVTHLAFGNNGNTLVVATDALRDSLSDMPSLEVWGWERGVSSLTLAGHTDTLTGVAGQATGTLFASTSEDGTLRIWDTQTGEQLHSIAATEVQGWFISVAFSPDGTMIIAGCADGSITFWDTDNATLLHEMHAGIGSILALAFHPEGKQLAVSTLGDGVRLFEVESEKRD